MPELTTIGFDADDTLWHHEKYFVATKARFVELLDASLGLGIDD